MVARRWPRYRGGLGCAGRGSRRCCARSNAATPSPSPSSAAAWLTAAVATRARTRRPLPLILLVGTIAGGVPWWAHRRRRAKVRVERTLDAWPDITAAIGLPGSRIMSAVVDRWGWRARIGLHPAQTATDLINATPGARIRARHPPGAVRVEPDPDRADHATIRVLTTDPHDHPIPYPTADRDGTAASPTRSRSACSRTPSRSVLRLSHRHGLLGGVAGAGKSGVLNVILAELVACPDVVLWGIDLKGGMELQPWAACLGRLATTPADAARLLSDAVAVLDTRARQMAADGSRLWAPTPHGARSDRRDRRVRRTRRRSARRDQHHRLHRPPRPRRRRHPPRRNTTANAEGHGLRRRAVTDGRPDLPARTGTPRRRPHPRPRHARRRMDRRHP